MLVKESNGEVSELQVSPRGFRKRRFMNNIAAFTADDFLAFKAVQELVFIIFINLLTAVNTLWVFSVIGAPPAVMLIADAAVEILVVFVCADLFCAIFMCSHLALGTSIIIGLIEQF